MQGRRDIGEKGAAGRTYPPRATNRKSGLSGDLGCAWGHLEDLPAKERIGATGTGIGRAVRRAKRGGRLAGPSSVCRSVVPPTTELR
eukprot:CAMPEP_0174319286 /NCGR_PEP_ID=MMETSP0810-20121108/8764_1 /TAXON_ID=73025 ORGANISM="Eutreptiella gymnastica-like, Strain CCMP1594" /NCGR_SAMPLE_ID=MMETSP0810 /ASSEMBLY_ACC=CAM_ASM_000659 /LENGTH=86 /DNA_ID=CAMNT_0015429779 /DNA_START=1606 /DNA_END=1862 /DNA_ORIENTATION=+